MQQREKILLGVLLSALVIWWGSPVLFRSFLEPLEKLESQLTRLRGELDDQDLLIQNGMQATSRMAEYRARSLPPVAIDAQRAYTIWLTDLLDASEWEFYEVLPGKITRLADLGSSVQVRIDGIATAGQFARFAAGFERSGLLHRFERLSFQGASIEPRTPLSVTLIAEAISLQQATRESLNDIPTLPVPDQFWDTFAAASPFHKPSSVLVRAPQLQIPSPILVRRGETLTQSLAATGLNPSELPLTWSLSGTVPDGLKIDESRKQLIWSTSAETEIKDYPVTVQANPATTELKPLQKAVVVRVYVPNTPPELTVAESQLLYPDETWTLPVTARDNDEPPQRLTFRLEGTVPAGMTIDPATGTIAWRPGPDTAGQSVTVTLAVTDSGTPPQTVRKAVRLDVRPDEERATELIACIDVDGQWSAWFQNREQPRRFSVRTGDSLTVGRLTAQVQTIEVDRVILAHESQQYELQLGQRLNQRTLLTPEQ